MTLTEFYSCITRLEALFNHQLTDQEKENYWEVLKHSDFSSLQKAITSLIDMQKTPTRIPTPIHLLALTKQYLPEPPQLLPQELLQRQSELLTHKLQTLKSKKLKTERITNEIKTIESTLNTHHTSQDRS
ncbi:MAG: hypothetical protein QXZ28_05615 [Candidatus Methanomethylicaceae archaeon]